MIEKNPNRTGVKAFSVSEYPDDPQIGECYLLAGHEDGDFLAFTCPGCGQFGGVRVGHPKPKRQPSWDVVAGSPTDASTLTLSPSINCVGCCGWHGYLRDGVFVSC